MAVSTSKFKSGFWGKSFRMEAFPCYLYRCLPYLDELIEFVDVFEFSVAIEQQCRVVRIGHASLMQLLEVEGEVVDPLCVEELFDNI